ncbi:PE family protein [Mycobacterium angelicum]|uniref:PE domain-containing protein n=1 Tax=Mycobacterium angelicum TaxID=470074 RepID=A0A1W9ZTG6_MYCAN|nr:PE family protein [Mycobacterium angelicum]MCV7199197.1 PE family protein [Mycobacterium angelicum]ORA21087.1 hypothetical protein BST12_13605 [Mycobacterium angelicum]
MSFVNAYPELVAAAAADLAVIRSTIASANSAAAIPTTGVLAPGADAVSAGIAALLGMHAQAYQTLSAQAVAFHDEIVQTLHAGANSYAAAEATNASPLQVVQAARPDLLAGAAVSPGRVSTAPRPALSPAAPRPTLSPAPARPAAPAPVRPAAPARPAAAR